MPDQINTQGVSPQSQSPKDVIVSLFALTAQLNGSDLHLVADSCPIIRVDGALQFQTQLPRLTGADVWALIASILTDKQRERFEREKELDLSFPLDRVGRFRVNLHWERGNAALAARLIPDEIPNLEWHQAPPILYDLVNRPFGLIVLTGPAGTGKSTLMASMLDYVNHNSSQNIITLEDPIEYVFHNDKSVIRQRELEIDMVTFAEGLRHVLRQDPNIIMLGELRDLDTISTCLTLAETGHLIFTTLHTNSAPQTIDRLVDVFPSNQQEQIRLQLSMTLQAVISQRLLPATGGGRVAAREIMIRNHAVANLIRTDNVAQLPRVVQTSAEEGMTSMDQSIKKLFQDGKISEEVAQSHMSDPSLLY